MKIFGITFWAEKAQETYTAPRPDKYAPTNNWDFPVYNNTRIQSFDGEKNFGEGGPLTEYRLEYNDLRTRSWAAMLTSDKAQIGVYRLLTWVIGKGLKPQCEPVTSVLEDNGIKLDKKKFSKSVENRFNLFRRDKCVDWHGQKTLNELEWEAEKNAMVGGDVLVILRYIKGEIKIQLIDGANVQSPLFGSEWFPQALANGNTIVDGVELNGRREHVAYYVRTYAITNDINDLFAWKYDRVEAKGKKTGLTMAYLYYGLEYRINNVRGMPIISACIEKLKQMEEYSTATLNQAKEAARVNYQVEHELNASGAAPWANGAVNAVNIGGSTDPSKKLGVTTDGKPIGNPIVITGIGDAYNMNPGSKISMLENKNPLYFKEFMDYHSNDFFAVISIPPNVAMGIYNDSHSASRAAIMDWANTLGIKRDHSTTGFKQPIVNLWMYVNIYENKIQAPGYILAMAQGNNEVIQAYQQIRFVGKNPPHIDPEKEAKAARVILGTAFDHVPLNDAESVCEELGTGNFIENAEQAATELELTNSLGIKPLPIEQKVVDQSSESGK